MRLERLQRRFGQDGAQVVQQDGGGADGKDSGLGARGVGQIGAVPGGEDQRVRALQGRADGDKAALQCQSGGGKPRMGPRADHSQGEIRGKCRAVLQRHLTGRGTLGAGVQGDGDASFGGGGEQGLSGAVGYAGQGLRPRLQQGDLGRAACGAQAVALGEGQFDAADAAADDDQTGGLGSLGQEVVPGGGIAAKRFGRDGMCCKARQVGQVGGDADIEAGDVVGHGWATGQMDQVPRRVKAGGAVKDHPCAGKAGEADQVDHDVGPAVMSGDQAGQHAGIGRHGVGVDHGQPCAGQGFHRPHPQHKGMGMTAADQDDIFDKGDIGVLHGTPVIAGATLAKPDGKGKGPRGGKWTRAGIAGWIVALRARCR